MKSYTFSESSDTPLKQYNFYEYAMDYYVNRKHESYWDGYDVIFSYFKKFGYDKSKGDKIAGETIKTARYIIDDCQRNYRAIKNQYKQKHLLKDSIKEIPDSFWCQSNNKYYELTDTFLKLVYNIGLVYKLRPENYYLVISDSGTITLKYQHIIGSRVIATITDWKV